MLIYALHIFNCLFIYSRNKSLQRCKLENLLIPKECQKSSSIKRWEKIVSAVSLIYMFITINIFDRKIYISEPHLDTFQFKVTVPDFIYGLAIQNIKSVCINYVSTKQCQQCKEKEKRDQEANKELVNKDQIITMLKEEVDKKEKGLTAMKGGKKKERTEMKKRRGKRKR